MALINEYIVKEQIIQTIVDLLMNDEPPEIWLKELEKELDKILVNGKA
jgi:hypothetical protein